VLHELLLGGKAAKVRAIFTKEPSRNNISNIECFGLHSV
jgi:hypothetical protein